MADSFLIKGYLALYEDIRNYIIAHCDKITDFNEGGVLTSQVEAFCRTMEQLYIKTKTNFENYFLDIPFMIFDFKRKEGVLAGGEVVFSRAVIGASQVEIPEGTIIGTEEGIKFVTTEQGIIAGGSLDSQLVNIIAQEKGKESNVPADSINTILSTVLNVDTVNNPIATTGGQDDESDYEYLNRFQSYVLGLAKSNKYGIMTGALKDSRVRSASIVEHFPALDNLFNFTVYIDDGAGNASPELVQAVKDILEGDGTETNPGYKAAGLNMRVLAPQKITVNVTLNLKSSGSVSESSMELNVGNAITSYINNLGVGEDYIQKKMETEVMKQIGIEDMLTVLPTGNIEVGLDQIARVNEIIINWI